MKQKNNLVTRKMMLATLGVLALAVVVGLTLSWQQTNKTFAQEKDTPQIQATTAHNLTSPTACVQPPAGLVSWWRAEGNANDFRGLNNGTLQNGATFMIGKVGQAFYFDGIDDLVNVPDSPSLDFTTAFTLEAWVRPDNLSLVPIIFSKFGNTNGNNSYELHLQPDGGVRSNVSNSGTVYDNLISNNGLVSTATWSHVAATFNSGTWKIFVNGVEIASKTSSVTSVFPGNANLLLGRDTGAVVNHYFTGLIDEPTVYNRALSQSEIQSIYNADSVGKCLTSSTNKFDFDADGKADISVFRPSQGVWYASKSSDNAVLTAQWGISTDKIVPADYNGDGKTDYAVFRDGFWYILYNGGGFQGYQWGNVGDIPFPADFDGDGKDDLAVFRNGTWFVLKSSGGTMTQNWGSAGDIPVIADYDGDNKADFAVYRNGIWYVLKSRGGDTAIQWGITGDKTVQGDYNGDGKADYAVFRNGFWYILYNGGGFQGAQWGTTGDLAAPADYDGDGKTDLAVFRNGTWYIQRTTAGVQVVNFGSAGDLPAANAFVR